MILFSAYGDKKSISGAGLFSLFSFPSASPCLSPSFVSLTLPLLSPVRTDPYYGGPSGFERAYQQCVRYSREFLDVLEKEGIVSSS